MTLSDIKTMLTSITGMINKVVYYEWPEGQAPSLPYICFWETETENFAADGIVYHEIKRIDIELYADHRDLTTEGLIESALTNNGIFWDRDIEYLDTERCYMTTYSIEV